MASRVLRIPQGQFRTRSIYRLKYGGGSFASFCSASAQKSDLNLWEEHRLTAEQLQFRDLASDFAKKELLPNAQKWDQEEYFPVDVLKKAANLGFGGVYCAQDVGGPQLSRSDGAIIFEALAYGDTSARQANNSTDYVLNGSKAFISGGGASDLYLVMARTGGPGPKGISCFLVEKGTRGLSFGRPEHKLGWRCQPTTAVILEDVHVPAENLLGKAGQGFNIAMTGLDGGRINIGSCSVGGAQYCLDAASDYVSTRKQFGKSIAEFQNTQFKLADMLTSIQASRLMIANAASALDAHSSKASPLAAMAKRFATDTCFNVANDALQLHGGYGYLKDYMVERYVRDLRVHSLLEGTNEIMRVVLSRHMLNS